jgi:hypothetical protein
LYYNYPGRAAELWKTKMMTGMERETTGTGLRLYRSMLISNQRAAQSLRLSAFLSSSLSCGGFTLNLVLVL